MDDILPVKINNNFRKIPKNFVKRIFWFLKPIRKDVIIAFILMFISISITTLMPFLYKKMIDSITNLSGFKEIIFFAILILVINLSQEFFDRFISFRFIQIAAQKVWKISNILFVKKSLEIMPGEYENKNSNEIRTIREKFDGNWWPFASVFLFNIFPAAIQIIAIFIFTYILSPIFSFIILFFFIITLLISIFINKHFKKDMKISYEKNVIMHNISSEIATFDKTVQEFNKTKDEIKEVKKRVIESTNYSYNFWYKYHYFGIFNNIFIEFTRFAIIGLSIYFLIDNLITIGDVVALLGWSQMIFTQAKYFQNHIRTCAETYYPLNDFFDFLNYRPKIHNGNKKISNIKGNIKFKNVSFSYSNKSKKGILNNLNLNIKQGEKVAIIGRSGAGKSTIIKLLERFYDPQKGNIFIDNYNLKDLDLKSYRKFIGVVPQECEIFDRTIGENMVYGSTKKHWNSSELNEIAKLSRINKFKDRLYELWDTKVGERGIKLSGGEKQRVAIARIIAINPQILIFDEATSNLDAESENEIRKAMLHISHKKTTIIIAHRKSTWKVADRIIVLDKGKIIGNGTHEELLKNCEFYKKVCNLQML